MTDSLHRLSLQRLGRRHVLGLIAGGLAASIARAAALADEQPSIVVTHDPDCGCCYKWFDHLRANGFSVTTHAGNHRALKAHLGVPRALASCHTGVIGDYIVEGHVPAHAIKRLLAERPKGRGLSVPGMPIGSPGMEGGEPETYDVILFGESEPQSFGRYREDKPV